MAAPAAARIAESGQVYIETPEAARIEAARTLVPEGAHIAGRQGVERIAVQRVAPQLARQPSRRKIDRILHLH